MRAWPAFLLALLLFTAVAQAQENWVQLDDPPPENEDGAPDPADMVDLFYATNATHLFLREDLASMPEVDNYTYVVYMDKPVGGDYEQDYRLVYSESGAYMEQWNGTDWVYVEDITVTVDPTSNSLIFEVLAESIGGLGDSNVKVWFENYEGADSFENLVDRGPNGGGYLITRKAIPNIPLLVLPAFVGGLAGAIFLLHKRFLAP
ncbi:MAG: hypothetical protein ACE5HJ_07725 [Thermoplasmata archaeon]